MWFSMEWPQAMGQSFQIGPQSDLFDFFRGNLISIESYWFFFFLNSNPKQHHKKEIKL